MRKMLINRHRAAVKEFLERRIIPQPRELEFDVLNSLPVISIDAYWSPRLMHE